MKKRIIASLLTASMLAAALAGCGGSTAQTADTSADAAGEAESAQGDPATVTEKRRMCPPRQMRIFPGRRSHSGIL